MGYVTEYSRLSSTTHGEYFVGYNSYRGFVGEYIDAVNEKELRRIYVIKGGAGTGKSTLMKTVAAAAKEADHKVERYACGSDPNSLDLVLVNSKVAILDGTSPHAYDPSYPGAASKLLDLSVFWNEQRLVERRDEIVYHTEQKIGGYERAYGQLGILRTLLLENDDCVKKAVDAPKLEKSLDRLVKGLGKPDFKGEPTPRILRSVGMRGLFRLDTFERSANTVITVRDVYSSAYEYMSLLAEKLRLAGWYYEYCFDPLCPEHICEIFIPSLSVLISPEESDFTDRRINMQRFIINDELSCRRGWLRLSGKCCAAILDEAKANLKAAGKAHFALEEIYSSSVDFKGLSEFTAKLTGEILVLAD